MKMLSVTLILISFTAAIYYLFAGLLRPESLQPYAKVNMPRLGIQLLSLLLGIGGMLLIFPTTFKIGGILLIVHSLTTIACYFLINDWKAGAVEFLFLQIPVFMIWAGYPLFILEKFKSPF